MRPAAPFGLAISISMLCACGGQAIGERIEEGPAPPCSINGMLFRDTPDVDFEQCGKARGVLSGEVAACVEKAMKDERPFVVQSDGPVLTPVHRRPALVGARFDEGYALRMYMSETEDVGQRTSAKLLRTSADSEDLSLQTDLGGERRCVMAPVRPKMQDETWIELDEERKWEFHPGECMEWFDAPTWRARPFGAAYDADKQPRCLRSP